MQQHSKQPVIAFIGAGNMAQAIIGGLRANGYPGERIWATGRTPEKLQALADEQGVRTTTDNLEAARQADVLILAVKPQGLRAVAQSLAPLVQQNQPLVLSVAAGINTSSLARWLGPHTTIVRTMPNTPSLVGCGACGLFATPNTSDEQRRLAESILQATGLALWVEEEEQLDAVTAVSGSGPAYYFLVMEAMIDAGQSLGLSREQATRLCLQTALGAARMAGEAGLEPAELRRRVTSPGGTTEQAILSLQRDALPRAFDTAMRACARRAAEMADELGGD